MPVLQIYRTTLAQRTQYPGNLHLNLLAELSTVASNHCSWNQWQDKGAGRTKRVSGWWKADKRRRSKTQSTTEKRLTATSFVTLPHTALTHCWWPRKRRRLMRRQRRRCWSSSRMSRQSPRTARLRSKTRKTSLRLDVANPVHNRVFQRWLVNLTDRSLRLVNCDWSLVTIERFGWHHCRHSEEHQDRRESQRWTV